MNILDVREKRFVTIRKTYEIFHAKRLTAAQYFTYRRLSATIDDLPPVDDAATQTAADRCRRELIRSIYANFQEPAARRELWELTLSEVLDRCELLLEGNAEEDQGKIGKALASVDPEIAVPAIMRAFPAYKLHHLALMPAFEFLMLYRLTNPTTPNTTVK